MAYNPQTSLNSVEKVKSFSQKNAQYVRHTYFDNLVLTASTDYELFQQGLPKGAVSNWGNQAGRLPNNISFVIKQIAIKLNVKGTGIAGLTDILQNLMPKSLLTLTIGDNPFGEFTLGEFLPSIVAGIQTASPNIVETVGAFNAQAVIDLPDGFLIPIEENATFTPSIKFATAPSASIGAELHAEIKGFKLMKTV